MFAIPNVKLACPPISLNTSDALLPSTDVPSIFKKSLSATPLVKIGMFVFDIPNVNDA